MKKISRRNFLLASGVVTIGAALTACGGSSSTSTAASSTASSAAASEAPAAGGKTLNIWCWNDEFQSRFNDYYPEVAEIAADKSTTTLKDGTIVKWTINPNDNNNYQNKLDEGLLNQESAADDDKIDIFLVEADYALKYVDSDYTLDVKADIGLTDADLAQQYQYTKDIVSIQHATQQEKPVKWYNVNLRCPVVVCRVSWQTVRIKIRQNASYSSSRVIRQVVPPSKDVTVCSRQSFRFAVRF